MACWGSATIVIEVWKIIVPMPRLTFAIVLAIALSGCTDGSLSISLTIFSPVSDSPIHVEALQAGNMFWNETFVFTGTPPFQNVKIRPPARDVELHAWTDDGLDAQERVHGSGEAMVDLTRQNGSLEFSRAYY
jgi:hypothetical protein